ncbi:MAG: GntR family transcriptional regulator [Clostridia bacterium]
MELKQIAAEMQPKSMAARDWVFQVIRTAIIRGILPGDMPLRQDEISAALSVSHIPVREAFRQLEAQGLVRIYPNRGAVVTKLSKHDMTNVMDTRIMLELGAIRSAMPLISSQDIDKASSFLERYSTEKDYNKFDEINLGLHLALYEPANNRMLMELIDQLHANVDRYIHPFYDQTHDAELRSVDEHRALIAACQNKDVDLATAVLRTHMEKTKILLLSSPLLS